MAHRFKRMLRESKLSYITNGNGEGTQVRINESSREYWQNPKRYARNADELRYGSPLYYIGTAGNIVSEQITKRLVAAGAKKDWSILEVGCNCGRNMSH